MNDEGFDGWLRQALAPEERSEDVGFAAAVQRRVALDEQLRMYRRAELRRFAFELVGIVCVAAALAVVGLSPGLRATLADTPHVALSGLLALFGLWTWVLLTRPQARITVSSG